MQFYAHSKGNNKEDWQLLKDHLVNTANLAYEFGRDAGISDLAWIAGILHDLGKYSPAFQRRLEGSKHRVDHSTAGAQAIIQLSPSIPQKRMAELLAYCLAGHHTGLMDIGSEMDLGETGSLKSRLKHACEDYSAYKNEVDLTKIKLPTRLSLHPLKDHLGFSLAFMMRMIYSTLVDADFQETETFVQGKKPRGNYESIADLCKRFNLFLQKFDHPEREIDRRRTETLHACIDQASARPGFFTLTVPTGGGKTLSSMAFALNHAAQNGLKRIIYVIPFTSIIEQNALVFKDCLGEETVLEHHSSFDWETTFHGKSEELDDKTNNALEKLKLAAENWDIPIIVTTNVQFFESLFSNRSSRCRKLHHIAKSVIIFDEAQMLPLEYMTPAMSAVWELVNNYNSSAIFCTATQPLLQRFFPAGTTFTELAPDPQNLFNFYRRVQVKMIGRLTDDNLISQLNEYSQALCIVNTRKHARGLYEHLDPAGSFHLSTLMCPTHRRQKLIEIRERLRTGQPCRVISTQVMEAGIDVDFPIGYRALAGLDSIIQAAGRVNREQKAPMGELYVFEPVSPYITRTPKFIEQGAAVAKSILRDFAADPASIEAIRAYFSRLYSLHDGKSTYDAREIMACFDKYEGFDFKTAAERFQFIENDTVPLIIPFNEEAKQLIEELKNSEDPFYILRKLQLYTINIYDQELEVLKNQGAIEILADKYSALNDMHPYSFDTGLLIPEVTSGSALFF